MIFDGFGAVVVFLTQKTTTARRHYRDENRETHRGDLVTHSDGQTASEKRAVPRVPGFKRFAGAICRWNWNLLIEVSDDSSHLPCDGG